MNNAINYKPTFSWLFISITFILINCCFLACDDEENTTITLPPLEEPLQLPDSINDLAAYLSSSLEVLLVDPEYVDQAIELMELTPTSDGRYEYWHTLPNGEIAPYFFDLEIIPIPELYYAAKADKELLLDDFEHEGVRFNLWRNAECGEVIRPADRNATPPNLLLFGNVAIERTVEETFKICKNSDAGSLCLETWSPVGKTRVYEQLDPAPPGGNVRGNLMEENDYNAFRCDGN